MVPLINSWPWTSHLTSLPVSYVKIIEHNQKYCKISFPSKMRIFWKKKYKLLGPSQIFWIRKSAGQSQDSAFSLHAHMTQAHLDVTTATVRNSRPRDPPSQRGVQGHLRLGGLVPWLVQLEWASSSGLSPVGVGVGWGGGGDFQGLGAWQDSRRRPLGWVQSL